MNRGLFRTGLGPAIALWPGTALAHSPIAGISYFYNGLLHPLIVPEHALVLGALSLALGQQGRTAARLGLPLIWGAFATGLGAGLAVSLPVPPEPAMLIIAAVVGVVVVTAAPLPLWLVGATAIIAGLALGVEATPDPASTPDTILSLAGLCCGVALASTVIAGTCLTLQRPWTKIGIQIVGSWIVAVSLLALALHFSSGSLSLARSSLDQKQTGPAP